MIKRRFYLPEIARIAVLVRKLLGKVGMLRDFTFLTLGAFSLAGPARAGDSVAPRQQFKESVTYPFVFKADGYLASKGPLPMRFGNAAPPCERRQPPAPPVIAKKEPPAETPLSETKSPAETHPQEAAPAITVEAASKREQPDFAKVPDEVLDFFKNTEGRPVRRAYLFDPIFQPVMPDELPKSKAISVQK